METPYVYVVTRMSEEDDSEDVHGVFSEPHRAYDSIVTAMTTQPTGYRFLVRRFRLDSEHMLIVGVVRSSEEAVQLLASCNGES